MTEYKANPFAQARVSMVDEILRVAGWKQDAGGGWIAPERLREGITLINGTPSPSGVWDRHIAIALNVAIDEQIAAAA